MVFIIYQKLIMKIMKIKEREPEAQKALVGLAEKYLQSIGVTEEGLVNILNSTKSWFYQAQILRFAKEREEEDSDERKTIIGLIEWLILVREDFFMKILISQWKLMVFHDKQSKEIEIALHEENWLSFAEIAKDKKSNDELILNILNNGDEQKKLITELISYLIENRKLCKKITNFDELLELMKGVYKINIKTQRETFSNV